MTNRSLPRLGVGLAALVALALAAVPASAGQLKGTFGISAGSYFRMIYPAAAKSKSKYFSNPYSTDADKTYTLVTGGTDGGLRTGVLQPAPTPAFDAKGNSLAGRIIRPTSFTGIDFGLVTLGTAPSISVSAGRLSGQLVGFTAQWNKLSFKQGSSDVSGTYNAKTHAYVLTWTSVISGGPFNGFTGYWHLQGKFVS
ncbi:MAG: hypothetical protein ABSH36_18775 [Solirubrobacteraceae bacterium]|jgi:hypothetical protein